MIVRSSEQGRREGSSPEPDHGVFEAYLESGSIRKPIAKVDVSFSNSMIEAVNKIIEYRYLFRSPLPTLEKLPDVVRDSVLDYNDRPHGVLKGLSPDQIYEGQAFDRNAYRARLDQGRELRTQEDHDSYIP